MKKVLIALTLLLTIQSAFTQVETSATTKRQKIYLAIIRKMDGTKVKGWFYKMDDSTVYLLPKAIKISQPDMYNTDLNNKSYPINISSISSIAFQKKNAALHGALIGFGIGGVTGATAGLISGDDPVADYTGNPFADIFIAVGNSFAMTAEEKALAYGAGLATAGALTGFIIGKIAKKKFVINGNVQIYHDLRSEFSKRVIIR